MNDKGEIIGRFAVGHSWDDIDNPFVVEEIREDPEERRRRLLAYAEIDRRRMKRRTVFLFFLALAMLAVLLILCVRFDYSAPAPGEVTPPPATEKPESEETTMHVIVPDWDELMIRAVLDGDERAAAEYVELGGLPYTYDDLYLLAKIIREEDGADGDGHEWPDMPIIALANVVLHRVRSPLFPNTIREVIYQEGPGDTVQYAPVHTPYWEETKPVERYVRLAQRALNGEEVIGEEVIYQALFVQGPIIMTYYDDYLGTTTYFCK